VASLAADGAVKWAEAYGGHDKDKAESVHVDHLGNVLLAGHFDSPELQIGGESLSCAGNTDIFVAKFSSTGDVLWANAFGGAGADEAWDVTTDGSGNILVAGRSGSPSLSFGAGSNFPTAGSYDAIVAKFSASGEYKWAKRLGGTGNDSAAALASDALGNVYVTGYFKSPEMVIDDETLVNADPGWTDTFTVKMSADGDVVWSRRYGGSEDDEACCISATAEGDVYLAGFFMSPTMDIGQSALENVQPGKQDIYLARLDSDGQPVWAHGYGTPHVDYPESMSVDFLGGVYLTGRTSNGIDFGGGGSSPAAGYMAKFDSLGEHEWSKVNIGGWGRSIDANGTSHVYLAGHASSSTDLGGGSLSNAGKSDAFVARFDQFGPVCAPSCGGKECGDDGCGGACGDCQGPQDGCMAGACVCQPACEEDSCADDGCGGSCGPCGEDGTCQDGKCSYEWWTDQESGLVWQNPPAGNKKWQEAKQYCTALTLGGFDDWHLPDVGELRSLIAGCPEAESCNVEEGGCLSYSCRDPSCGGCAVNQGPGGGGCYWSPDILGTCSFYWSSSAVVDLTGQAWTVYFVNGNLLTKAGNNNALHVRCVRESGD